MRRRFPILLLAVFASVFALAVLGCESEEQVQPTPTTSIEQPTATPEPTATATVAAIAISATPQPTLQMSEDCVEPEDARLTDLLIEMESCSPSISNDTRELIRLFLSLEEFKTDPEFHRVGFAPCCQFKLWLEEVEAFRDSAGIAPHTEVGLLPGELLVMGLEYVRSAGRPWD